MKPETQAFLNAVRDAEDPTPEDQRRVRDALRVTSAVVNPPPLPMRSTLHARAPRSSGLKLGTLSVCAVAAAMALGVWRGPTTRPTQAVFSPDPARSPAPKPPSRSGASLQGVVPAPAQSAPVALVERGTARAPRQSPSLRAELALLAEVRAALQRGDGPEALRRLDAHRTTDRQLLPERRAARILALCAAGLVQEARKAAADFEQQHPTSLQRAALAHSCAGSVTELR